MTEMQIALAEGPPTNLNDITLWAESFWASSTNKPAKELRSVCDVVWINNDVKHWLAPSNRISNPTATAMIGRYQYEGRNY